MRTTLILMLSAWMSCTWAAEPDGFRGLKWGQPVIEAEFSKIDTQKKMSIYSRRDDRLRIGDADLLNLTYGFYDGQFHSVLIKTDGSQNGRALLAALKSQFGDAYQQNRYIEKYSWFGQQAYIVIDCRSSFVSCQAIIASKAVQDAKEADDKRAAANAKGDF